MTARPAIAVNEILDEIFPADVVPSHDASIQWRFETFHRNNPLVYAQLVRMTRDLVARGRQKVGIGMLWEVLRWQVVMGTFDPSSEYKLNDHYRSRYARLIMEQEVDLAEIFETRGLRSA